MAADLNQLAIGHIVIIGRLTSVRGIPQSSGVSNFEGLAGGV
jgi:hypothetical protein